MKFKVTSHKDIPPATRRTGMTEVLRALQVKQSVHIPFDDSGAPTQRTRIGSLCRALGREGMKFSVRVGDKGFDVYRIE